MGRTMNVFTLSEPTRMYGIRGFKSFLEFGVASPNRQNLPGDQNPNPLVEV